MDNQYLDFFLNENISISPKNFVINLIFALILSFLIRLVYLKFSTSLSNKNEFSKNFVILGLTTCIVITIVKSSLALSLGLVGALSIVRFRAAIKEPEELVYLFLVIAVGLGTGAGQLYITAIGAFVSLFVVVIFYSFRTDIGSDKNEKLHASISFSRSLNKKDIDKLVRLLFDKSKFLEVSSIHNSKDQFVINIFFMPKENKKTFVLIDQISKNYPDSNVIISKDHNIAL